MTIISGAMRIQLPGSDEWQTYNTGEVFEVAAQQTFKVKVAAATAYFCTYS
jgi:uncharacterized protein YaiE (UPF0345 family)